MHYDKKAKKFKSQISINNKRIGLGRFDTVEEAFETTKKAKELYIKDMAIKWKSTITTECYDALFNRKIEITD